MAKTRCLAQAGLFSLLLFTCLTVIAAPVTQWSIVPAESTLSFTGTQNNSPITGHFKDFSGEIMGDPEHLDASKVHITVDMNSLTMSYKDIADTLDSADWFNVKGFPKADFTASQFTKTGDKTYQAKGTITIMNKTMPVTLTCVLVEYSKQKAKVNGSATLKRSDFGVGKGDWASFDEIKNEVQINFTITAVAK